jgi:putative membrane-bound dehydrogenase-like protein
MRFWWTLFAAAFVQARDFPEPYDSERVEGSPMPAEEAARSMKLPPGFNATVFAAEPEVRNPIACAWDPRGRLWVVENFTYAERPKRFDLVLQDRVVILEDANHDGRAEKPRVFIDTVQRLTSVEVGRGGVWLMCPPQLLFVPDADGDDVPDGEPQVMLDGFTVADGGYHNLANGLKWGPDGWLYGRCGHSCPGKLGVPGTPGEQRIPIHGGIIRSARRWRCSPMGRPIRGASIGTGTARASSSTR